MRGRKSTITERDFKLIIDTKGTVSSTTLGKKFGVTRSQIAKLRCAHFKYGANSLEDIAEINRSWNKPYYEVRRERNKIRSWENQVDEGIEIYQHVMRRYYAKKFWYLDYKQLKVDFQDIQRMKKAA